MKLVKSLLLGSAAGLMAVAGAQAADLPVRKAAPVVDYVRVCSAYGVGFFFIPGSETCLRISGRVRAEYRVQDTFQRDNDLTGYRARGQLNLDARTQTAYGTLRTFIRYELTYNSGAYGRPAVNFPGFLGGTGINTTVDLNKAFIQFAGITAGRATSFFDFYANALNFGGSYGSDSYGQDPVVLAYTASFGSGFSATVSIEDPSARRVSPTLNVSTFGFPGTVGVFGEAVNYSGQRLPEIVGQLRVDQAWGSAQLSGALHQINVNNRLATVGVVGFPGILVSGVPGGPGVLGGTTDYADTEYGFAVQAGVKINLPMIAAGDQLWLQAAYADGAVNYLGLGLNDQGRTIGNLGAGAAIADGYLGRDGDIEKARGFNVLAAFLHYWTPQIRQAVFANYTRFDVPNSVSTTAIATGFPNAGIFPTGSLVDFNYFSAGTNLIWSPVAGLDIGAELLYEKVDPRGRTFNAENVVSTTTFGAPVRTIGSDDRFQARLRIQRDF